MTTFGNGLLLLGVLLIGLGIGVLLYPPLLVALVSVISVLLGLQLILFGFRVRKFTKSFHEFRDRFFIGN